MDLIRRIEQELRGELGRPHHWGVEIKWWGKRNKKEISKKNHTKLKIFICVYVLCFIFYLLFIIYYLLFIIYYLLFIINY